MNINAFSDRLHISGDLSQPFVVGYRVDATVRR